MRINDEFTGFKEAAKELKTLGQEGQRAVTRALNKTATKTRTLASKDIRSQVNLKAGYVREKLRIKKATFKQPQAVIYASRRGVLMTRYPHKVLSRGVSVRIKKGKARKVMKGAFVTTVNAGGKKVQVIAVQHRPRARYSTGNLKFDVLYGPSVSQVFQTARADITPEVEQYLAQQIEREIDRAWQRVKR